MKVLQKLISLLLLTLCVSFHSCGYDDEELWSEVNKLQERIEKLEDICTQTNANIHSIQTLLDAMKQNYSIASITPLEGDKGYTITFTNNKSIILYNGVDGNDGEDGKDGENGKDGVTPQIGVKDLGNGYYAWTLNGEVLTDNAGNPLHVNGKDGEDGTNGTSGSSAPTPQLKTGVELVNAGVSGNWDKTAVYISVNGGMTWTKVSASGTNPLFTDVDTSQNDCVVFTLTDGTTISVPRTDKILDLLFGEWTKFDQNSSSTEYKYIFNKDNTFQILSNNKVYSKGEYEFYPLNNMLIGYEETGYKAFVYNIIEISKNKLFIMTNIESNGLLLTLYKTQPVILSQTEVNAPKEGGAFYIDVQTEEKLQLKDITSNVSVSTPSSIYFSYEPSPMSATYELKGEKIEVQVEGTTAEKVASKEIGIFNERGYCLAKFTIKQQGVPVVQAPIFSVYGKSQITNLLKQLIDTQNKWCNTMDLSYTNIISNSSFNVPLLSGNNVLYTAWTSIYQTNTRTNDLFRIGEQERTNGPLSAPLKTVSAIIYYQLVKYWGDIPYIKADDDSYSLYPRTPVNEIFSDLTSNLISAISALEEKKNDNSSDVEKSIFFSKDVARMALAHIYMYQGKYQEALLLLNNIVKNGFYSLEASKEYTDIHNKEVIFAQITSDNTFVPIYTYTDVILSLVECEMYANNTTKAMEYIQQVADKKRITITESDTKQALKEVYKATLANYGGYFAFLKRNGLAVSELGLSSEDYLLFPIPQQEMQMNPNLVQNPGY